MTVQELPELVVAAGSAFGSGAHPSTALSLQALQGIAGGREIASMLDMGCGSGILSIAAAKYYPDIDIIACDIVQEAVEFTRHNAEVNEVLRNITAFHSDGFKHWLINEHAPYDLVLCNVLAEPIILWMPDLKRVCAPDGLIVVAGIMQALAQDVLNAVYASGLEHVTTLAQGDWVAMILRNPEASL